MPFTAHVCRACLLPGPRSARYGAVTVWWSQNPQSKSHAALARPAYPTTTTYPCGTAVNTRWSTLAPCPPTTTAHLVQCLNDRAGPSCPLVWPCCARCGARTQRRASSAGAARCWRRCSPWSCTPACSCTARLPCCACTSSCSGVLRLPCPCIYNRLHVYAHAWGLFCMYAVRFPGAESELCTHI